jgi:hypothetical protein
MRGLVIIPVLIGAVALFQWFMTHGMRNVTALGDWFTLPKSVLSTTTTPRSGTPRTAKSAPARSAGVYPGDLSAEARRAKADPLPEAGEPGPDFSGIWMDQKNSAILRLKQVRSTLAGEYAPAGDMAAVYQFKATVQDDAVRFDLKMAGALYHCTLEWEEDSLVLRARKDIGIMLSTYSMDNRLPNGVVVIAPKTKEQRARYRAELQKKRDEIKKAVDPVVLGRFDRIGK